MTREYFLKTKRLGFSKWKDTDLELANHLWGDKDVTRFICAAGVFTPVSYTHLTLPTSDLV